MKLNIEIDGDDVQRVLDKLQGEPVELHGGYGAKPAQSAYCQVWEHETCTEAEPNLAFKDDDGNAYRAMTTSGPVIVCPPCKDELEGQMGSSGAAVND